MFERIIAGHAQGREEVPAYDEGQNRFSYQRMADDIERCAGWLQSRGISPGCRVVLHLSSAYQYWVLFFALEATGAISIAVPSTGVLTRQNIQFMKADLYITDQHLSYDLKVRGEAIDQSWLIRMREFRRHSSLSFNRSADDPICIVLSSGTTGSPKKILLTRRMIDERIIYGRSSELINETSRTLLMLPKHSIGALMTALSVWAVGGTLCIRTNNVHAEQAISKLQPTMIAGAPSHYSAFLSELPAGYTPPKAVDAAVGGGALPAHIAALMSTKLRGQIKLSYASTEMGFVARGDYRISQEHDGAVGYVLPFVEVSIRDAFGRPLPHGQTGEIWVRSPHVVSEYLENPEQTAASFRDGWYHPGDIGVLRSDGLLAILGRTDDLINYLGMKVLPSEIEKRILNSGSVDDVVVFQARKKGMDDLYLWIMCVNKSKFDKEVISSAVPKGMPYIIVFSERIARNAMGKVERASLRAKAEKGEL